MSNKKKSKMNPKIKVMIGILIVLLIILAIVVTMKNGSSESKGKDGLQVTEEGTIDGTSDGTSEDSKGDGEKKDGDSSEETAELMTSETAQQLTKDDNGKYQKDEAVTSGEIACEYAAFSGQYVEDGRDELVENVAAILVTNNTEKYLDFASLVYDIDGETATFIVSGLPAGKSAWVMEKSKMTVTGDEKFTHKGSMTSFKDEVTSSTDNIKISSDGNMLTATNKSGKTLKNVAVYYKVKHDDGNYFGGITYVVDFGDLKDGESVETLKSCKETENSWKR